MGREKVCVIGLGNVGYPTAVYIKRGYDKKATYAKDFHSMSNWKEVLNDIVIFVRTPAKALENVVIKI